MARSPGGRWKAGRQVRPRGPDFRAFWPVAPKRSRQIVEIPSSRSRRTPRLLKPDRLLARGPPGWREGSAPGATPERASAVLARSRWPTCVRVSRTTTRRRTLDAWPAKHVLEVFAAWRASSSMRRMRRAVRWVRSPRARTKPTLRARPAHRCHASMGHFAHRTRWCAWPPRAPRASGCPERFAARTASTSGCPVRGLSHFVITLLNLG